MRFFHRKSSPRHNDSVKKVMPGYYVHAYVWWCIRVEISNILHISMPIFLWIILHFSEFAFNALHSEHTWAYHVTLLLKRLKTKNRASLSRRLTDHSEKAPHECCIMLPAVHSAEFTRLIVTPSSALGLTPPLPTVTSVALSFVE